MTRVSTDLQELDIQEEECIKMAVADGYINDKEHIILIPRLGESARKIGEIETVKTRRGLVDIELDRDGIWDMKEHIRLDPEIDCVYIWEVSRLARRMEILTPLLKYFADKKIQLKIKTSGIEFLNPDKSVNSASKMTIEILGEVAEQEMDIKIKRFKRTKKVMAEQGRYAGSFDAMFRLATYYENEGQYENAVKWYEKSADCGYIYAIGHLGLCYQYGKGVKADPVKAKKLLDQARENGVYWNNYTWEIKSRYKD